MPVHAITIDLEDWHPMMSRRLTGRSDEPANPTEVSTHRLIDTLHEAKVRRQSLRQEAFEELCLLKRLEYGDDDEDEDNDNDNDKEGDGQVHPVPGYPQEDPRGPPSDPALCWDA